MAKREWWDDEEPWVPSRDRFTADPQRHDFFDSQSHAAVTEWWVENTVDRIYRRSGDTNSARLER